MEIDATFIYDLKEGRHGKDKFAPQDLQNHFDALEDRS
jgi:hypothetical protein